MARGDAPVALERLAPWLRGAELGMYGLEDSCPDLSPAARAEIDHRREVFSQCAAAVRETIELRDRTARKR
ncbi:MAG: hypothetical protein M3470_09530, partial [Chloroflexota bacterium]|nr:hypothetical protein [Chloroflexota bacterium]